MAIDKQGEARSSGGSQREILVSKEVESRMSDVTQVLAEIESGDPTAPEKLLPLVYEELRKRAAIQMAQQGDGQTLQATALVHEAYVRMVGNLLPTNSIFRSTSDGENAGRTQSVSGDAELGDELHPRSWRSRQHFFCAAAQAMKQILVDNAKRKQAEKHGGDRRRKQLVDLASPETMSPSDLLDLDEALKRLAHAYPRHAKLVELLFFAGVTQEQAADCLGISVATARRHWDFARAWLFGKLANPTSEELKTLGDGTTDR